MLDRTGSKKAFQVSQVRMDPQGVDEEKIACRVRMGPHRGDKKITSVSGWTLTEEMKKSNEPPFS